MAGSYDDPIEYIKELLEDDGIVMSREIIELIIGYYRDFRFDLIMNGISIREKGLYDIYPILRRYYDVWRKESRSTLKLRIEMDEELAKALMSRFLNSEDVRGRITKSYEEDDIRFIREKLEESS